MLRRAKKKDEQTGTTSPQGRPVPLPEEERFTGGQGGPFTRSPQQGPQRMMGMSGAATLDSSQRNFARQQQQQQQQQQQGTGGVPTSSSLDAMPPPGVVAPGYRAPGQSMPPLQPSSSQQYGGYPSQSGQHLTNLQSMGRSQSAFNFLLSKAKGTFSSSSSAAAAANGAGQGPQGAYMNSSASTTSLVSQGEEGGYAGPSPLGSGGRPRLPSTSSGSNVGAGSYPFGMGLDRGSMSDLSRYPGGSSRPALADENMSVSSPTRRGFFSSSRDRKSSNASSAKITATSIVIPSGGSNSSGAPGPKSPHGSYSHSPLSKAHHRQHDSSAGPTGSGASSGSYPYAQFSKSQSDLHSRPEYPDPSRVPMPNSGSNTTLGTGSNDTRFLRSPSPVHAFSKSVDDLSQAGAVGPGGRGPAVRQASQPQPQGSGQQQQQPSAGTWGEHGVAAADWGRPSDTGTMQARSPPMGPVHVGGMQQRWMQPGGQVPLSSQPQSMPWVQQPQQGPSPSQLLQAGFGRHQRKTSKLSTGPKDAAASAGRPPQGGSPNPNPPRPPRQMAAGVTFEGFLSRNANISLPLAQLTETTDKGKEKEKDVSKGWKPFRVVLRDDKLLFYKPPSGLSDEVKSLFPTAVVPGARAGPGSGSEYAQQIGVDADALLKGGLGTQELLLATSSSASGPGGTTPVPAGRMAPRRNDSSGTMTSMIMARSSTEPAPLTAAGLAIAANAAEASLPSSWHAPGQHADLVLAQSRQRPASWAERIHGGTPEALAHELVYATQAGPGRSLARASSSANTAPADTSAPSAHETDAFVLAAILAMTRAGRPLLSFVVALHKWATVATGDEDEESEEGGLPKTASPPALGGKSGAIARVVRFLEAEPWTYAAESERPGLIDALDSLVQQMGDAMPDSREEVSLAVAKAHEASVPAPTRTAWLKDDETLPSAARVFMDSQAFLQLNPADVAQQIHVFHADALRSLAVPAIKTSTLLASSSEARATRSLFAFDGLSPHFLTQLVLDQLFDPNAGGKSAQATSSQSSSAPATAPRTRAALLRHWIAISSYLLGLGDLAGWAAVCGALCARATSRLEQTWRYVAASDRDLLGKVWAPQLAKLGWVEEVAVPGAQRPSVEPLIINGYAGSGETPLTEQGEAIRTIPYFGSLLLGLDHETASQSVSAQIVTKDAFGPAAQALRLAQSLDKDWAPASRVLDEASIAGVAAPDAALQKALASAHASRLALDSRGVASYLEASLQAEPRSLGNVDLRWRPSPSGREAALSLTPLLFSEPLPNLTLLDRERILRLVAGDAAHTLRGGRPLGAHGMDNDATIRSKVPGMFARSPLAGSPLVRSKQFFQSMPGGKGHGRVPLYAGVGWAPGNVPDSSEESLVRVGSELILGVQPDAPSAPSSPMANKRFSTDLARAARPLSQASKRSSLPASNRSSFVENAVPVHVFVRAGTLERLVDVLVMGVQHVQTNPPDEVQDSPVVTGRKTRLSLDLPAYRSTFLATHRNMCPSIVLFDFLQKRFQAAISASKEMSLPAQHRANPFPTWSRFESAQVATSVEPVDWELVSRIRMGIITVLRAWISRYPQDFADDRTLYASLFAFGEQQQTALPDHPDDMDRDKVISALQELLATAKLAVMAANVRQPEPDNGGGALGGAKGIQRVLSADLDFDRATPSELVDFLECIAAVFLDKVTERDLLIAAELFANQAAEPAGWHAKPQDAHSEPPNATNMYKLLEFLRAPGQDRSGGSLQQKLPSALRDACAAQNLLRGWIAIHIIEPRIGLARRQARLAKLLNAVWICRARMSRMRADESLSALAGGAGPFQESTICSFIESVISGSLTASESRIFTRAWQGIAVTRNGSGDNLSDLYPSADAVAGFKEAVADSSTPDIGWILRCLAEAVSRPSELIGSESMLIDFDRFRSVYGIIESSIRLRTAEPDAQMIDLAGARLNVMQSALRKVAWDRRAFKEDAIQEANTAPPLPQSSSLRAQRILGAVIAEQQEKYRRDRRTADELASIAHLRAQALSKAQSALSSDAAAARSGALSPTLAPVAAAAEKRTRRMTALFRGAIKPTAFMGEKVAAPEQPPRSADELLDLVPTQKPALTASCGSSVVAGWNNSQRSFVFHFASAEGHNLLLQAPSQRDMAEWFSHIEKAAKTYAVQRQVELPKAAKTKGQAAPLYGIPIANLVEREQREVPLGLERMLAEVEARGLREQGIYRISGAKSSIEGLKETFSKQSADSINLSHGEFSDVHTIAGAIKQWFRDLPEPAVPFSAYHALIAAERIESHEDRLYAIRDIVWDFPKPHFDLLRRISEHLARVVDEGEHNLMAPHNIGLVFGTSLLNPPPGPNSVAESFGNIGKAAHIVKLIVTTHDWLFEPEPEAEAEAEVDEANREDEQELAEELQDEDHAASPSETNGSASPASARAPTLGAPASSDTLRSMAAAGSSSSDVSARSALILPPSSPVRSTHLATPPISPTKRTESVAPSLPVIDGIGDELSGSLGDLTPSSETPSFKETLESPGPETATPAPTSAHEAADASGEDGTAGPKASNDAGVEEATTPEVSLAPPTSTDSPAMAKASTASTDTDGTISDQLLVAPGTSTQQRIGGAREGAAGREESIYLDAQDAMALLQSQTA